MADRELESYVSIAGQRPSTQKVPTDAIGLGVVGRELPSFDSDTAYGAGSETEHETSASASDTVGKRPMARDVLNRGLRGDLDSLIDQNALEFLERTGAAEDGTVDWSAADRALNSTAGRQFYIWMLRIFGDRP